MATLQELIDQKAALERQITAVRNEGRAQALAKAVALMRESGLSIDDVAKTLESGKRTNERARKPVPAKYRDPATGSTWSGRGLKPRWLVAALEAGRSLGGFAV
jgi:DNA-binding protein H-NS